ncbi:hypothetical protein [Methanobrevibacter ruminantium]|uniref:hypothetical protein n=1 Tax=Methanobrevibacter ruminantium TaxID=83816 RepID=UPI003F064088
MEDLKNYDDKLIYFVIFNISLFLLINFNYKIIIENQEIISLILTVPILYLPTYLINNMIDREKKFKLLYFNKPLNRFASDIFTKIRENEIKYNKKLIDIDLIEKIYGNPKNPCEEDELWYTLYNKHKYDPKIYQQNRQFLLCRDFTSMIIPFTIIFSIIVYFLGLPMRNIFYIFIVSLIELVIFRYITIKHNEKFALSVLQEETNTLKKDKHQTRLNDFNK